MTDKKPTHFIEVFKDVPNGFIHHTRCEEIGLLDKILSHNDFLERVCGEPIFLTIAIWKIYPKQPPSKGIK